MKKYIIGVIVLGIIVLGSVFLMRPDNGNKPVIQKKLSYQYSTEIWTKVPLQAGTPRSADLEFYAVDADLETAEPVATLHFPDKLIRKERALLVGTKSCFDANRNEEYVCSPISERGIAITMYPEPYESLVKKFTDGRYGVKANATIGGYRGEVFTQQVEFEGRNFYVLPIDKNSTLVALVDYYGEDKEYSDFTAAQLNAIVSSAKLE